MLHTQLLLEQVAPWLDDGVVIMEEDEWEGLLLAQGPVQVSLQVVDLCVQTGERLHDDVGVALDEVADVDVISAALLFYVLDLFPEHILAVLKSELWQQFQNRGCCSRIDAVLTESVVDSLEIADGGAKQTA